MPTCDRILFRQVYDGEMTVCSWLRYICSISAGLGLRCAAGGSITRHALLVHTALLVGGVPPAIMLWGVQHNGRQELLSWTAHSASSFVAA